LYLYFIGKKRAKIILLQTWHWAAKFFIARLLKNTNTVLQPCDL
jgi:hypothetical protein